MSIESVVLSNCLNLCRLLLLLPSIFPSIQVFSNDSVLCIRWLKYWRFSFSINPSNEYSGLISFRMDWLDLLAVQGILKSLLQHHSSKASIRPHSAFRWLGHYIYWYDLVHLAIWFLFVLSVLCFPFSVILPYLKLSGYLCRIFAINWYYFFLKRLDKILFYLLCSLVSYNYCIILDVALQFILSIFNLKESTVKWYYVTSCLV